MRKIIGLVLILTLGWVLAGTVYGQHYTVMSYQFQGDVVQVIDGDSLVVREKSSGKLALVRLLGVDTTGFDTAVSYLNGFLPGSTVSVYPDANVPTPEGIWNVMYVEHNGKNLNWDLLNKGYGKANDKHQAASEYSSLVQEEAKSKEKEIGLWAVDVKSIPLTLTRYAGNGININTATQREIVSELTDIDSVLASRIVEYRENNPFTTVMELKFVNGFTADDFNKYSSLVTVSTNINTATEKELLSLDAISSSAVKKIIEHRESSQFVSLEDLVNRSLISSRIFDLNEPFLSLKTVEKIEYSVPDILVDLNDATESALQDIGFTSRQASAVVRDSREYSYKTIEEIQKIPNVSISRSLIDKVEDNLFISVAANAERININTASLEQLRAIGLDENQAYSIYRESSAIRCASEIPVNVSEFDAKIALYTNINTASATELQSLSAKLSSAAISAIGSYRTRQPFGSLDEVKTFLLGYVDESEYSTFRDYIVLR